MNLMKNRINKYLPVIQLKCVLKSKSTEKNVKNIFLVHHFCPIWHLFAVKNDETSFLLKNKKKKVQSRFSLFLLMMIL